MMAAALMMASTVWYVPGWMRTQEPQSGVLPAISNVFPKAEVAFRGWDGDRFLWRSAVENADAESVRMAEEIAQMGEKERRELVVVGHSLGARITARALARLSRRGLKIRQAFLLAAAIPYEDADLQRMGLGSDLPVWVLCNADDVVLRYVYATLGGEHCGALGANGLVKDATNVVEFVVPADVTRRVEIGEGLSHLQAVKAVANHHVYFYIDYMRRLLSGETPSGMILVPQDFPLVVHKVLDDGLVWETLETFRDWRLQRHRMTRHCRILSDEGKSVAWGRPERMEAAFVKVMRQLQKRSPLR